MEFYTGFVSQLDPRLREIVMGCAKPDECRALVFVIKTVSAAPAAKQQQQVFDQFTTKLPHHPRDRVQIAGASLFHCRIRAERDAGSKEIESGAREDCRNEGHR